MAAGRCEPVLHGCRPPLRSFSGPEAIGCREESCKGVVPRLVGFTFAHASYHYERLEQSRQKIAKVTGVPCILFDFRRCRITKLQHVVWVKQHNGHARLAIPVSSSDSETAMHDPKTAAFREVVIHPTWRPRLCSNRELGRMNLALHLALHSIVSTEIKVVLYE